MTTSSKRYYEVTGETRKKILAVFDQQAEAIKKARALTKELGAEEFVHTTGFAGMRVTGFKFKDGKEPDSKLLNRKYSRSDRKHLDWYSPNRSTKVGKELSRKLDDEYRIPGHSQIAEVLKLKQFVGLYWRMPGTYVWGPRKRVFATIPIPFEGGSYSPRGQIAKDVKRISDIEFEKIEAKYAKKKKK